MRKNAGGIILLLLILQLYSCKNKPDTPLDTRFHDAYVVVVSMDAFRWDYADIYTTPEFEEMEAGGVRADYLLSSFPTKTFPNHYALATGLFPDHNGIINNNFYAPDLDKLYRIGDRSMVENPDAYFGEPIWVTAEQQGKIAASFYWVGSEAPIKGISPTYWKTYNHSTPYTVRVKQVISWLKEPLEKRPELVMLYFDQPDGVGHDYGPESTQTGEVVESMDSLLGSLRDQIAELPYADRVNLIVLADHGMAPISPDKYHNLYDYIHEDWVKSIIGGNPVYLVAPLDGYEDSIIMSMQGIEGLQAWEKEDIPAHLHYGSSPRFPGIVVVADSMWSIGTKSSASGYTGGAHGYDNHFTDMRTIFYAEGPAFKEGYSSPAFSNVEVYGIIAHILGLDPAETDGDIENVRHIFKTP